MLMLRFTGYGAYALAVAALMMLSYGLAFLGAAVSLAATGTLFLAADKVISVLGEIRDRLPTVASTPEHIEPSGTFDGPVRSAAQIDADLKRLRGAAS